MTGDDRPADERVERLPAVVEYAALSGAIIGPQLASGVGRPHARREIETIIEQQELGIVFQPSIGLARSQVVGFEALTRFQDGIPSDRRFRETDAVGLGAALELACLRQALGVAGDSGGGHGVLCRRNQCTLIAGESRPGASVARPPSWACRRAGIPSQPTEPD